MSTEIQTRKSSLAVHAVAYNRKRIIGTNPAVAPAAIFLLRIVAAERNVPRSLNGVRSSQVSGPRRNALTGVALGVIADISSPESILNEQHTYRRRGKDIWHSKRYFKKPQRDRPREM